MDYGKVTVKNGGELIVDEATFMYMYGSGKLIVEDGGKVTIKEASRLVYEANSYIELSGNSALLDSQGDLQLGDGATFTFVHPSDAAGYVRFGGTGQHIFNGVNASIVLSGDGSWDKVLELGPNADLWPLYELDEIRITQAEVVFGDDARIVCTSPLYLHQAILNTPTGASRGIFTAGQAGNLFVDLTFDNTQMDAHLFYRNQDILRMTNCEFVNAGARVNVVGKGYSLRNVNFTNTNEGIVSANMTVPSMWFQSTAVHAGIAVVDNSPVEVTLKEVEISQSIVGVDKFNGKLTLKCANVHNNSVGVKASDHCWVNMSTIDNGGYNVVSQNPSDNFNVANISAFETYLGYNDMRNDNGMIIVGSIDYHCTSNFDIITEKNQWTDNLGQPPANQVALMSDMGGCQYGIFDQAPSELAACGTHDKITIPGRKTIEDPNDPFITTSSFPEVAMTSAIIQAQHYMEMIDTAGDDLIAIDLFYQILTDTVDRTNESVRYYSNYALTKMKSALGNAFITGKITTLDNALDFHPSVQQYVDVMMALTDSVKTDTTIVEQFYLEMDKAHLYRLIDRNDMALGMMQSLSNCPWDSLEADHLNYWLTQVENEIIMVQAGVEAIDSLNIDTTITTFVYPSVMNGVYEFGADIQGLNSVQFTICGNYAFAFNPESAVSDEAGQSISIYPNPGHGLLTVDYNLGAATSGALELRDLSGKLIAKYALYENTTTKSIDLSEFAAGAYIYRMFVDGGNSIAGKLILR